MNQNHSLDWALDVLGDVYPDPERYERKLVTALLSVANRLGPAAKKTSEEQRAEALYVFHELMLGRDPRVLPESPVVADDTRTWGPAKTYYPLSDVARVNANITQETYELPEWLHEGLTGTILGVRRGIAQVLIVSPAVNAEVQCSIPATSLDVDITHLAIQHD